MYLLEVLNIFGQGLQKRKSIEKCKDLLYITFILPSCNAFLSQMANTSLTILSKELFKISFLVQQAALEV